ncbi:MAG TPA: aldo/keto reductase [Candidatus Dormibacteraeota bacterium]|nr:aldo/keto reductase [Candidatus Dormibacteraeota bacterium]
MKYVEAGGVRMSAIGLGTWQFGSMEWGYGKRYAAEDSIAIVHRALELGVNVIDTAEIYGQGRSEKIVGQAIRDLREKVFLATKLFPIGLPIQVGARARASARRLGVERIDLYQLHWPSPVFPLRYTMPRFKRLVDGGLVANIGVSNFPLKGWQDAEVAAGMPVLSNQVQFSLVHRGPEADLLPWAQKHDRIVIAYSPLGQGLLSGRYRDRAPSNFRRVRSDFRAAARARLAPLISALEDIGSRHRATAAQVALAWLIAKPNVVAIPGASSLRQMEENAAAGDLELTGDELERLSTLTRPRAAAR